MHFTGAKSLPQILLLLKHKHLRLPNQCNALSQRNNLIKLTHYHDETKKRAHDSENLKLSYGVPSQRQASGTNGLKLKVKGPH